MRLRRESASGIGIQLSADGNGDTDVLVTTTTYAPSFTGISNISLNPYIVGTSGTGGANQSTTVTPHSNYDGVAYTVTKDQPWLTLGGTTNGTANVGSGGSSFTVSINTGVADTLSGVQTPAIVTLTVGSVTQTFTVSLTITVPTLTATTVALGNYNIGSSAAAPTGTFTPTNTSVNNVVYTLAVDSGTNWLTITSSGPYHSNTTATGTAVAFTVIKTNANSLTPGATATGLIDLVVGSVQVGQISVTLPVVATTLSSPSGSALAVPLSWTQGTASLVGTATSSVITSADNISYTATVASGAGNSWLTVQIGSGATGSPETGTAGTATTPLTYHVNLADTNLVGLAGVGQHQAAVALSIAGTTVATVTVTLTVAAPVLTPTASAVTLPVYYVGSASPAVTITTTSTPTASVNGVAYTASILGSPSWITITSGGSGTANTPSGSASNVITLTVQNSSADALTPSLINNTATVQLKVGTSVVGFFVVTLPVVMPTITYNSQLPVTILHNATAIVTGASNIIANANNIAFTTAVVSTPSWLNVTSAPSGLVGSSTPTALSFAVNPNDSLHISQTLGPLTAVVNVLVHAQIVATFNVQISVVSSVSTLTVNPSTLTFATSYAKGGTAPSVISATISDTNLTTDTDSIDVSFGALPQWLHCVVGGSVGNGVTDTLACNVVTGANGADAMNPGLQTAIVNVHIAGQADVPVTVNLTITAAVSPLTANPNPIVLTYLLGGQDPQATASTTSVITSTDPAWDTYTVTNATGGATLPAWLTAQPNLGKANSGNQDSILFTLVPAHVPTTAGSTSVTLLLHIAGNSAADRPVVITMNVVGQPMSATPSAWSFTYTKGGSASASKAILVQVPNGAANLPFTVDPATIPVWLSYSVPVPTATTAGTNITFSVNTASAAGMAIGNYTTNVGLKPSVGYTAELLIGITMTVQGNTPALTFKEGVGPVNVIWGPGMQVPVPPFTPMSSNEPISFTASCLVNPSDPGYIPPTAPAQTCTLNSTAGVAYTWGYGLTATLDPNLFASTLGNTVSVTVTVVPQGGSSVSLTYVYSLQPVKPTITAMSPSSAAHIPVNTTLVVTLTGTGFVGTGSIKPNTLSETLVWVGSSTTAISQSRYVVLDAQHLMITLNEADFPTLVNGKAAPLAIGVANQTGLTTPTVATASWPLNVTTAPVVYGVTSTASFIQPNPGSNPNAAPYELLSIFGDNFGLTGSNLATATMTSFNQVPTTLTLSGTGAKAVNMTVAFKALGAKSAINAPILFANQNQINLIVPSALPVGTTATVTVTSGTSSSDGIFTVNTVAADPGIFTLASDGIGQGAILNDDNTVNKAGHGETSSGAGYVSIYMTGLGAPDSTAFDILGNGNVFPTNCVAVSSTVKGSPGYMQVVNSAKPAPTPVWTSIDGAVIQSTDIVSGLPPCMNSPVTVVFGALGNQVTASGSAVLYAGFTDGSVAGLYQVVATIPQGAPIADNVPVYVTIGSYTSPTVTMAIKQ